MNSPVTPTPKFTSDNPISEILVADAMSRPLRFGDRMQIAAKEMIAVRQAIKDRLDWFHDEEVFLAVHRVNGGFVRLDSITDQEAETLCKFFAWLEDDDE
jgi:hypothetical protein